jgi:hypothetical protein
MKSKQKRSNFVIATMALVVAGQSIAQGQKESVVIQKPANTTAAAPEDAQALSDQRHWQSLLKLAAKPDAVVTVKDLEDTYQQKAVHREQVGFFNYYSIKDFVTLFPDGDKFSRKRYPNRASVFISFYFFSGNNAKTCVTHTQAVHDLQEVGWRLHSHSPGKPIQGNIKEAIFSSATNASDTFLKDDQGIIIISYPESTGCIGSLRMEADKLEFDRIINESTSKDNL